MAKEFIPVGTGPAGWDTWQQPGDTWEDLEHMCLMDFYGTFSLWLERPLRVVERHLKQYRQRVKMCRQHLGEPQGPGWEKFFEDLCRDAARGDIGLPPLLQGVF